MKVKQEGGVVAPHRRTVPPDQRTLLPGVMPSTNNTFTSSPSSAARIMPWLSTPQSTAGFRFATSTTR